MAQFIEQDPGYLCYDGQWLASINRCNGYPDCAQGKTLFRTVKEGLSGFVSGALTLRMVWLFRALNQTKCQAAQRMP